MKTHPDLEMSSTSYSVLLDRVLPQRLTLPGQGLRGPWGSWDVSGPPDSLRLDWPIRDSRWAASDFDYRCVTSQLSSRPNVRNLRCGQWGWHSGPCACKSPGGEKAFTGMHYDRQEDVPTNWRYWVLPDTDPPRSNAEGVLSAVR